MARSLGRRHTAEQGFSVRVLLGIVCEEPNRLRALVEQAARMAGAPDAILASPTGTLMGWGPRISADPRGSWLSDGRLECSSDAASPLDRAAHARGDFAFLGLDDGLVLGSGQAGGYRPLYASTVRGASVGSTSFGLLTALLPGFMTVDPDALAATVAPITLFRVTSHATPFREVTRLPMYEVWRVALDGRVSRRGTFRPLSGTDGRSNAAHWASELREALVDAVRVALKQDERAGVLWSGGLDSTAVLSLALDIARSDSRASPDVFTWDYPGRGSEADRPFRESAARQLGVSPVRVTATDAARYVGLSFVQDGLPFNVPAGPLMMAMAACTQARGTSLLVSGVGGDDVLDGEPRLLADLALRGRPVSAVTRALRLRGPFLAPPPARVWQFVLRPMLRRCFPPVSRWAMSRQRAEFVKSFGWAGPRLRRYLADFARRQTARPFGLDWTAAERFESMARWPLVEQGCVQRAQEDTITRCPRRDPFLDEDFLRVAARVPPLDMLDGGYKRGLLRRAMAGPLPEDVRLRVTKGNIGEAFKATMNAAGGFARLEAFADVSRLADLGLIEPKLFRAEFDAFRASFADTGWLRIFPALSAEAWLRAQEASS